MDDARTMRANDADESQLRTRGSLLRRLGDEPDSQGAWQEFVRIYGTEVIRWCRGCGLQDADAADVAQDVLVRFWKQAAKFSYDPGRRFRGYLRQIVQSAIADWAERRVPRPLGGDDATTMLESLPAREDLIARIEQAYDTELLDLAMREVQGRVKPHTWQAFHLLAIERLPGEEVARRLSIDSGLAYVARRNVQRMIREAVERLEGGRAAS
jgi:RNA polymerase sigma factor (sigma-70 family)